VTEAVLNPGRTTEQKILDSLQGATPQMGDKIYVYFTEEKTTEEVPKFRKNRKTGLQEQVGTTIKETIVNNLSLKENWDPANPNHSVDTLLKKLYNTLVIFEEVIDISKFTKYHNKTNKEELRKLLEN
jgi:hypothetical protein